MHHITISTTGMFDEIRSSLVAPVEKKEVPTFIFALNFSTYIDEFDSSKKYELEDQDIKFERKRIREFVKAVCKDEGKPFEECRSTLLSALPEFIRYGTYNGAPLLSTPRNGSYEIYAMYKSVEGRRLIFQELGSSKERAQYVYDHMLRYFITKLFSNMGNFGYISDSINIETPLSVYTIQQTLDNVVKDYIPFDRIQVSSTPTQYVMNKSNQVYSEFLLIADALGAYMVQEMKGDTESEQLVSLSSNLFFRDICKPMCRLFIDSSDAHISVYDECNSWVDNLIEQFWYSKYTAFRNTLREVPRCDDGVLAYVKASTVFLLVEAAIKKLSLSKLGIELHAKQEQYKEYLDFLLAYDKDVDSLIAEMHSSNNSLQTYISGSILELYNQSLFPKCDCPPNIKGNLNSEICCQIYCAIDSCKRAIRKYHMYERVFPIVDYLDALVRNIDIPSTDSWEYEYISKVSRISKWYRALAYAFTGSSEAESIFKELIQAQEQEPLVEHCESEAFVADIAEPVNAFSLDFLHYALLQYYVETNNRKSYELYIETIYPSLSQNHFDFMSQMHTLLGNIDEADYENYNNGLFCLWIKALWHFYLDCIDEAFWHTLASLWDTNYNNEMCLWNAHDFTAHQLILTYLVKFAAHFGDTNRIEKYREYLEYYFDSYIFTDGASLGYDWNEPEYYIMAQVNEQLGNLELAQEQYDKAYALATYSQAKWKFFEAKHGNRWGLFTYVELNGDKPNLAEWLTSYSPAFSTIDEYKKVLAPIMSYVFN
ncbi:MAG: hypothetical protein E7F96_02080 [Veillonella sp.]|uniref:hypothetical protein n=1 Tax=Veillonella sp. TaxID=1926307 RepID=UPI002912C7D9|nr:hypothetical protein [Veillonella sp.]MDU3601074.1 hypothetical protein [Veillonella sp.]